MNYKILGMNPKVFSENFKSHLHHAAIQVMPILLQSKSWGQVTIISADPKDKPIIDIGYFGEKEDIVTSITAARQAIEMIKESSIMKKVQVRLPEIESCKKHRVDLNALETFTDTFWHYSGTAKMGYNKMPVVDSQL